MDFPSAPLTSATAPAAPSAGTPARLGQTGQSIGSSGSGKSFSSVLHSVSGRRPGEQQDTPDSNPSEPADQSALSATTTAPKGSGAQRTDQSMSQARTDDKSNDKQDDKSAESASTPEPATQSLVLALMKTPVAEPTPQSAQEAASTATPAVGDQQTQQAALSPLQEQTAFPAVAPEGAKSSNTSCPENATAALTTTSQSALPLPAPASPADQTVPPPVPQTANLLQPGEISVPHDAQEVRKAVQKEARVNDDQPAPHAAPFLQPHDQPGTPETVAVSAPQRDGRVESEPNQSLRGQERAVVHMRPEPSPEPAQTENEPASREATVTPVAWQSFSDEQPTQNGFDLSGHERRSRQGDEMPAAVAGATSSSVPLTYAGGASGVADPKTIFSATTTGAASPAPQPSVPHTVQETDWMPVQSSNQTRSVVLEVAQADLGRVNIRVAVNQDVVYAHLTSDRSEVGQFLINGQDKLQAALQNSGLDMGQFRVDIDRQSAGRSFQHHTPQGHSDGSAPYREGTMQGQPDEQAVAGPSLRPGMLNLVA